MEREFPAPRLSIRLWCEGGPQEEAPGGTCMVWGAFAPPHTPESPITYTGAPCAFGKSPSPSAHRSCGSWHWGADAPGQDSLTRPAQIPGPGQGGLVPLVWVTQPLPPAQGTNIPRPSQPIHHVGWVPIAGYSPGAAQPGLVASLPRPFLCRLSISRAQAWTGAHDPTGCQGHEAGVAHASAAAGDAVTTQGGRGGTERCGSN